MSLAIAGSVFNYTPRKKAKIYILLPTSYTKTTRMKVLKRSWRVLVPS